MATKKNKTKTRYPIYCLIVFAIFWIIMAINPSYRYMWFVENTLLIIFLAVLILTYKKFQFSNTSYTLIFIFCILQTIGAHYTYAEVPIDFITNFFHFQRNHYDRIVHFSFGLLLSFPFMEFYKRTSKTKSKFWLFVIPILAAFAVGAIYEIIEWIFAVMSDPNASDAFLGSQGDIWDAQKDTFLAGLGAMITMIGTLFKKEKNN